MEPHRLNARPRARWEEPTVANVVRVPDVSRALPVEVAFLCVPISDLRRLGDFYARLFGRPADIDVNDDEVMWCVVPGAAWLYVVVDRARAGRTVVTLSVGDLEAVVGDLAERGIEPARREEVPGAGHKAILVDPDGNEITLLEVV